MSWGSKGPADRRRLAVRVKSGRGRKASSTRWLQRQLNDPYVRAARESGYRSRAAFKLIELDDRFHLLEKGLRVVDLGAAPGGWTQVAVERVGARQADGGRVVAVDVTRMEPVAGATILDLDAFADDARTQIESALGGPADLVLSDMSAPATGHAATDHVRVVALCEAALELAEDLLRPGGAFVAKVLHGGTEQSLLAQIKRRFAKVRHAKPPASRSDSAETYLVATGLRPSESTPEDDPERAS